MEYKKLADDKAWNVQCKKLRYFKRKYRELVEQRSTLTAKKRDEMLTKIANLEEINEDISYKLHNTTKEMLENKVKAIDEI